MKVWLTKYALTRGIDSVDAEIDGPLVVVKRNGYFDYFHINGAACHRTEAAAIQHAEAMRTAKIASLKRSIAKLEKLRFMPLANDGEKT